ncbi:MAG: hypothetical protein LBO66_10235, partial [Deltaproteobacteria bacterium]|nr:hypothetical protein [Deltaproteobacteria bacterium]
MEMDPFFVTAFDIATGGQYTKDLKKIKAQEKTIKAMREEAKAKEKAMREEAKAKEKEAKAKDAEYERLKSGAV